MEGSENVIQLERVRCLECGATYVKPADGGTVHENPGCPKCGYLGWISTKIPATGEPPRHFVADPLRNPAGRSR
jgi:predicted nucleic-acid-binding Zn-ribbon protein